MVVHWPNPNPNPHPYTVGDLWGQLAAIVTVVVVLVEDVALFESFVT